MIDSPHCPPEIAGYRMPQDYTLDMADRARHVDIPEMSDEQLLAELWGAQSAYARAYGKPTLYAMQAPHESGPPVTAAEWLLERVRRLQAERVDRQSRSRR